MSGEIGKLTIANVEPSDSGNYRVFYMGSYIDMYLTVQC